MNRINRRVPKYGIGFLLAGILLGAGQGLLADTALPPAPDFTLPDTRGKSVSLRDFRGQYILINFWATWCAPCIKEMPEIEAAYRMLKDKGFIVLAINAGERKSKVRAFIDLRDLTFPVLLDRHWKIAERYNIIGLPVSFFIGPQGKIHRKIPGGTLTKALIANIVEQMENVTIL